MSRRPGALFRRIVNEAALTIATDAVVLAAFFVFYRLLLDQYGAESLGIYTLMRRYAALLLPLLMLGLSDGLGRFIAATPSLLRARVALAGALGVLGSNVIFWAWLSRDSAAAAGWLFGDASLEMFVNPFCIMVIGLSTHQFVHACLRGFLHIRALNVLQLANLGIVPIVMLALYHGTFPRVVWAIGAAQLIVSLVFLAALRGLFVATASKRAEHAPLKALYKYSLGRIPAAMVGAALLSLAPIIAKDYVSLTEIGYLSLSLGLLLAVGGAILPLGTVLLPHISAMNADSRQKVVSERLHLLIGAAIQVYLLATFQFFAVADYLLELWMGKNFLPALRIIIIVAAALPFYALYCATRGVLDAVSLRPINSINTLIALLVLIAALFAAIRWPTPMPLNEVFAAACSLATAVLGIATYVSLRLIFPQHRREDARHLLWGVALSAGFFVLSWAARPFITSSPLILGVYEAAVLVVYVGLLYLLRFQWPGIILGKTAV